MSKVKALTLTAGIFVAVGVTFGAAPPPLPLHEPATTTAPASAESVNLSPKDAIPLTKADVDIWLDGYLPYAMRTADIPGASLTIVKDGQLVTARGFGFADVEKHTPVDPETTLFRPGSVSKLVTWTAAMQLVEQGKLDLDADINKYLDFKLPDYEGKPVTLRQCMTHTGGFEEHAKDVIFFDPKHLLPLGEFVKRSMPARAYAPGTTPAYSNWATALTGYVIERVSGESFDDYVDHHIFQPLGMTNASFRQPLPPNLAGQVATGYLPGKPGGKFEIIGPAPAGSLSASGTAMAKFMMAHLDQGKGILKPETEAMMLQSPLDKVDPYSLVPPLNRMELGFFETNINGREVVGHLGDTEFFHTSLHLFLKENVGIYFSFNSPGKNAMVQTLRTGLFQDFADRYFPATSPKAPPIDEKTAAEHARMMVGAWQDSRTSWSNPLRALGLFGQTKVGVGPKGELSIPSLKGANGQPYRWVEIAPFVWRERDGHDRLAGKVENGQVVRWSFELVAPFIVFDRVPASRSSTWILPTLYLSLGVLALTLLSWPVAWFARRRFNAPMALSGNALRAYRATRVVSGLVILVLVGWLVAISMLFGNVENFAGGFDVILWLLQIGGVLVFLGAVAVAGWNAWLTWHDGRRWQSKTWSALVVIAALVVLYVAFTFNLMAMTVNY